MAFRNSWESRAFVVLGCWLGLAASATAHNGHTSPEPWHACASSELGDACEWDNKAHDRFIGTCRRVSDDLLCVRNKPIVPASARRQPSSETNHDDAAGMHAHARAAGVPWAAWGIVGLSLAGALLLWRLRSGAPEVAS